MVGKGALGVGEELLGALKAGMKRRRDAARLHGGGERQAVIAARCAVVGEPPLPKNSEKRFLLNILLLYERAGHFLQLKRVHYT